MTFRAGLPLVAVLALAGCGSSSGDSASASTEADASQPAKKATPASGFTASAKKTLAVAIKDFDYAPKQAMVAKGAKVTWTNDDSANHTVTFDSGAKKDLGSQSNGAKVKYTFAKAGTFAYHCDFHPNMHGTITVR